MPSERHTSGEALEGDRSDAGLIELAPGVSIRAENVRFQFSRSRGPGGQNVNKQNTRAELRVAIAEIRGLDEHAVARLRRLAGRKLIASGEILIAADTSRSQQANRRACIERLSELVERASRPVKPRKRTKPSKAAMQKRLEQKKRRSALKQDRRRVD
jgi:ribosome-associated protein